MQFLEELTCSQCKSDFLTASELLIHFATHALEELNLTSKLLIEEQKHAKKKTIPDLRPIVRKFDDKSTDKDVNPLTICEVTFDDHSVNNHNKRKLDRRKYRKYICLYCTKRFGWPTDLKRHIFTHTDEKPYKCTSCKLSYTRKFTLHKHIRQCHKIPDLKPINIKFANKVNKF